MTRKRLLTIAVPLSLALVVGGCVLWLRTRKPHPGHIVAPATLQTQQQPDTSSNQTPNQQPSQQTNAAPQTKQQTPTSNASQTTITDPGNLLVVVNKQRALPSTYVPANLVTVGNGQQMRSEAATAAKQLVAAASAAGVPLKYISGYRSYAYQQSVYNGYVQQSGQAAADTFSARPGHSEHQTGLAVDLGNGTCDLDICFGDTTAGKWLAANAHTYGFIIRYPNGKTDLTGYQYEPWHIRYVGTDVAGKIYASGQTLEQYFGLPAATSY